MLTGSDGKGGVGNSSEMKGFEVHLRMMSCQCMLTGGDGEGGVGKGGKMKANEMMSHQRSIWIVCSLGVMAILGLWWATEGGEMKAK